MTKRKGKRSSERARSSPERGYETLIAVLLAIATCAGAYAAVLLLT